MASRNVADLPERATAQRSGPVWAGGRMAEGLALLCGALSLGLAWWLTGGWQLPTGLAAGMAAFAAGLFLMQRIRAAPRAAAAARALPDWAVARAVAQQAGVAIAVSDRAGRLICANDLYTRWFDGLPTPPDLPFDEEAKAHAIAVGRTAWRDGSAEANGLARGTTRYRLSAVRAGGADEYMVWRIEPQRRASVLAEAGEMLEGSVGRVLARAGIAAATVGPDGRVRAANPLFAERAGGRADAGLAARDLPSLISVDSAGVGRFTRESERPAPVRFLAAPLDEQLPEGAQLLLATDDDARAASDGSGAIEELLAGLPVGAALTDREGRFLFLNDRFQRAMGIGSGNGRRLPLYPGDLVVREDKAALADTVRRHAIGPALSSDITIRLAQAPDEPVQFTIAGVRGQGPAAVLLAMRDSGEESQLKHQVAQASKMQAVGQLAGGVAHDFNNILTAIIGACDLMLLRHTPGDSDYDDIQQIKSNSNRAASLTRQLLAFSRQQTLRPEIVQLADVVADVSSLLKRLIGEKIALEQLHGRGLGPVRADPGQLEQVIVNLAVNARDAMDGRGTLTIETADVTEAEVRRMARAAGGQAIMPPGRYARLSVSDTGHGMNRETLAKIFEPFFTTKEKGKGTGLGLATVYGIVKQSGGYVFADSEPRKGTRFDIYLPVHGGGKAEAGAPAPVRRAASAPPRDAWGTGHLLLVEDEDMVRAVAERALVRQGYTVDTASDGEEGLERLVAGGKYDLIVSDVVMPNMDGPAMARAIRSRFGAIPILFMSGYAEEQLRKSIAMDRVYFLPKPFSVQQIAEAVADALADSGASAAAQHAPSQASSETGSNGS